MAFAKKKDRNQLNGLSQPFHSIRTKFSFASGVFLLLTLIMCYTGGRIVLVHFLRDAESQIQGIGVNVSRLVNRNADHMRQTAARGVERYDSGMATGSKPDLKNMLENVFGLDVSLAAKLDDSGRIMEAYAVDGDNAHVIALKGSDFEKYQDALSRWVHPRSPKEGEISSTGIVNIHDRYYYAAVAPCRTGGFLLLAMSFDMRTLVMRMNESNSGASIKILPKESAGQVSMNLSSRDDGFDQAAKKVEFGLTPMISVAMSYYSGGFWEFADNPMDAKFMIRDIAGDPISVVVVSLPRTFSSITHVALSRLTFFITMIGILLILPIFWLQSQILLNPLSRMIALVREVGEKHNNLDCPRLEWHGKDEFAQLAVAVNRMLETLSGRAMAVAQSESRQKAMLENMPDGLFIFDRRHRLISIVKQPDGVDSLPGFVEGNTVDDGIYGENEVKALASAIDSVLAGERMHKATLTSCDGQTKDRKFAMRFSRMDDFFVLASVRDITAENAEHENRIDNENRLARVRRQESMSLLAAGIAHDVNNVLAVVLNTLEITWVDGLDPDTAAAVATIRDAVHRGSAMMRELMTYAGETKIQLRRCSPLELVKEVSHLATGTLPSNVLISYNIPEDLPYVDADPDQLWKVFFNLAKNSAEALNGKAGEIAISAEEFEMTPELTASFSSTRALKPGPGVLFWVSDNGPGIPPEVLKRIFDPYVSTKGQGHGLGLAIIASIVKAHGGGISVQTEIAGGTTFSIFLPVSRLPPSENGKTKADGQAAIANRQVLVIEDDPSILTTTRILLKALDAEVFTADNPDIALDQFRRFAPTLSCVLLDANLGSFNTVNFLRTLRIINSKVPVIVTSGSAEEDIRAMFKAQPFDGFLSKPYTLAEMKDALLQYSRG